MELIYLLSLIVFLPVLGALVIAFLPGSKTDLIRNVTFGICAATLALSVYAFFCSPTAFDVSKGEMQNVFNIPWIPSFNIEYFMGVDGISLPLVMLTTLVSFLAMWASWSITKYVKAYCILFLLLETGMIGVFLALDFFLFYVFWEVMLLPMYFLIGVWGGPRKEYAALKFFLYTLAGSVLMLIAILMLYFNADLSDPDLQPHLARCNLRPEVVKRAEEAAKERLAGKEVAPVHTFNILAMQQIGQHTDQFMTPILGYSLQRWAFILLFIGFAIKVPSVPVHTWLPDAHVEAPTPISMILAGILLKMGGYGIIRMCYPICPMAGYDLAYVVCGIGVVSMIYGAFAALAQKDFKRMVAYSSVSHMGYVVLGLGVWSANAGNLYNPDYWNMGVQGAMFQMIGHGISSAGMFFMVGVVYDRVHHRNLEEFGGLFGKMPVYTAMAIGIFFAGLGLPGLCGFIGEVFVVLSVWMFSPFLAVLSASVVILTAAYILWAIQRVYLGAEYKGPHEDHLTPSTLRENVIGITLLVFAVIFGVFPYQTVLKYMDKTITQQTSDLAEWTNDNIPVPPPAMDTPLPGIPASTRGSSGDDL
jgi:NADH-quinone oxidoreductase subunit M